MWVIFKSETVNLLAKIAPKPLKKKQYLPPTGNVKNRHPWCLVILIKTISDFVIVKEKAGEDRVTTFVQLYL